MKIKRDFVNSTGAGMKTLSAGTSLPEQQWLIPHPAGFVVDETQPDQHPAQPRKVGVGTIVGMFVAQAIRREGVGNRLDGLFAAALAGASTAAPGAVALIRSRWSKTFVTPVAVALDDERLPTPRNVRPDTRLHHHSRSPFSAACRMITSQFTVCHYNSKWIASAIG